MRARWRRELDQAERDSAIVWRCLCSGCGKESVVAMPIEPKFCIRCGHPKPKSEAVAADHDPAFWKGASQTPIVRGSKVRRIDEPYVVLHVREVDVEGKIDGTGKVLCFNSFGHGRWMRIDELEVVS